VRRFFRTRVVPRRADEIAFFGTLTWIRRGGRAQPPGILNAASSRPLLDVATDREFIWLSVEPPRELVLGIIVGRPAGQRRPATPDLVRSPPPGFAVGTINFLVKPDGPHASLVSTETRVSAGSADARRRFAAYWRLIYPGSALIRREWLRAIERRAIS